MLCPECGTEVGDSLKLCPPCDQRKQDKLRAEAEQHDAPKNTQSKAVNLKPADLISSQSETDQQVAPLENPPSIKGPLLFLFGVFLAGVGFLFFFFFGGPTSAELDRAKGALVGLVCQTNTVEQVVNLREQLLYEKDKNVLSANAMSKWKLIDATMMSVLGQSKLGERQFSKLRRLSDEKRSKFISGIIDQAQLTCMYDPAQRPNATKALEWITSSDLGRFR